MRSFSGPLLALALILPVARAQTAPSAAPPAPPAAAPASPAAPAAPRRPAPPQQPTFSVPPALKGTVTFACGQGKNGATSLFANTPYSETSAGWDLKTAPKVENGTCSSDKPFFFSIPVPEGNYRVKILFGGPADTVVTVRAEARRLMLEKVAVKANAALEKDFDVNVRVPEFLNPDGTANRVRLKQREFGNLNWDNKLTLEFNGTNPSFHAFSITPLGSHADPVVYLGGDSTMVDQDSEPWASWGQQLPRFFLPGVVIANNAESGETSASFQGEQRFAKIMSVIKTGDFFFMQFNHNDQKPGAVPLDKYKQILTDFVTQVRAKNAVPVIVTAQHRRSFDASGHITNSLGDYPDAARQVAADTHAYLIDLTAMSEVLFNAMGDEGSKHAFMYFPANTFPDQTRDYADNTHFNGYGAYELARCIVKGIRENKMYIAAHIDPTVPVFDPAKPDPFATFYLPPTPSQKKEDPTQIPQANLQ
jgi:lysophospholipase L1-like esterase